MANEIIVRDNFFENRTPLEMFILDNGGFTSVIPREDLEVMCEAASKLICPFPSMTEKEILEMELRVIEKYEECANTFIHHDGAVAFVDVFNMVSESNSDIFDELAGIEYHYMGWEEQHREEHDLGPDDDLEFDETHSILSGDWENAYYDNMMDFECLDEYIKFVLNKHKLSYSFESNDLPFDDSNAGTIIFKIKEVSFMANDAQNVLNPELLFYGFSGYGEYVNYYEEHKVDTKLLGGAL